jgi:predicted  nucleic acid-binding Zn ribbon protein
VHCTRCNLEIRPDELGFTTKLVDEVASWRGVWGSIYDLWLDSGEYESWATKELSDLNSPANQRGRAVVKRLAQLNPCYFQVFENETSDDWSPVTRCQVCSRPVERHAPGRFVHQACHECRLLFWAASLAV